MAHHRTVPDSPIDFPDSAEVGRGFLQSLFLRISVSDLDRVTVLLGYLSAGLFVFLLGGWMGLNASPGKVMSDELKRQASELYNESRRRPNVPITEGPTGRPANSKTNS